MPNFKAIHVLVVLGLGVAMLSCGGVSERLEPTAGQLSPTSSVAHPSILPFAATGTPNLTAPEVPDRSCPAMTGEAPPMEAHSDSADHSQEIADYLSAGGSLDQLRSELEYFGDSTLDRKATVHSADVTGDGQLDVVVELLWLPKGEAVSGYVYVLMCSQGRYVGGPVADFGFTASFADPSQRQTLGLRAVEDLTGDSTPELLLSFAESPEMLPIELPDDYALFFKVIGWDGSAFVELLPEQFGGRPAVTVLNGDGELRDTDGDGLRELVLQGGASKAGSAHPLRRANTETWGWTGGGFALRCATFGAPTYRFQAVEDGDAAMLCRDLDKALESYQRAVFDEALRAWEGDELGLVPAPADERQLLGAYSRYRIMLIHLASGAMDAAAVVYETLSDTFGPGSTGYPFVVLAALVFDEVEAGADLSDACGKAIAYAVDEGIAPLADEYGYSSQLYAAPEYLCPAAAWE